MSKAQNFSTVDIFSIASNRQKINTKVTVSEMPELESLIINSEELIPLKWKLKGLKV